MALAAAALLVTAAVDDVVLDRPLLDVPVVHVRDLHRALLVLAHLVAGAGESFVADEWVDKTMATKKAKAEKTPAGGIVMDETK